MFTPATLEIVLIAFEGPDGYSLAGGLGVRVRDLARALAHLGFRTTLVFVGDPGAPSEEMRDGVHLVRWCQDISQRYPTGVYQGEYEKIDRLVETLPDHLITRVVAPAARAGRVVAVMAEEWHTAGLCRAISDRLHDRGLRARSVLLWNANNHFGFDRIDWASLNYVASLTTVSRYMKHLMWPHGVNPVVIPNGIAAQALRRIDPGAVGAIRAAAGTPCLVFKLGRFSADKRWHQALAAVADLRAKGLPARLVMRGGIEPFGAEVLGFARSLGLDVVDWYEPMEDTGEVVRALEETGSAAVVNVCRFIRDEVVREIDAAATAVLANSGHEPFGLVGLEAMAAGGVAVVGATGEEYARPYGNAIVIETEDGAELASALHGLIERPALGRRLRASARRDAEDFVWPKIIDGLLERLRFMAVHQRVVLPPDRRVRRARQGDDREQ